MAAVLGGEMISEVIENSVGELTRDIAEIQGTFMSFELRR
jgi:hypothetical protein